MARAEMDEMTIKKKTQRFKKNYNLSCVILTTDFYGLRPVFRNLFFMGPHAEN